MASQFARLMVEAQPWRNMKWSAAEWVCSL